MWEQRKLLFQCFKFGFSHRSFWTTPGGSDGVSHYCWVQVYSPKWSPMTVLGGERSLLIGQDSPTTGPFLTPYSGSWKSRFLTQPLLVGMGLYLSHCVYIQKAMSVWKCSNLAACPFLVLRLNCLCLHLLVAGFSSTWSRIYTTQKKETHSIHSYIVLWVYALQRVGLLFPTFQNLSLGDHGKHEF